MLYQFIIAFVLLSLQLEAHGFTCTRDGLFTNPDNGHSFFHCSSGVAHLMSCPSNLVWNQEREYCDWTSGTGKLLC